MDGTSASARRRRGRAARRRRARRSSRRPAAAAASVNIRPVSVTLRSGAPLELTSTLLAGARPCSPAARPVPLAGAAAETLIGVDDHEPLEVLEPVQVVEHLEEAAVDLDRRARSCSFGPPPVLAAGGVGAIESQSMPAADAMSFAWRMNSPRSGCRRDRGPQRPQRRLLLRRVPAQLLELPDRVLELLLLALRRRRPRRACRSRSLDVGENSTKYQRRMSTTPPATIPMISAALHRRPLLDLLEPVRARRARDVGGRGEVHEVTAARVRGLRRRGSRSGPRGP